MSKDYQIKYEWTDLVYDENTWTNTFLPAINQMFEKEINNLINKRFIEPYENAYREYNQSLNKYKKEHNGFLYFITIITLPFAFLLFFFPGYYLWKKFKSMNENKKTLKSNILEKENTLLQVHNEIINYLPPIKIFVKKIINDILHYRHFGPVTNTLIETIKSLSLFNFHNDEEYNTFNTSWGIFNNNIVIFNAFQSHTLGMKTYTGSVNVSYSYIENGETRHGSELVVASYTHPCPFYDGYGKMWCFSESCDILEFNYVKYYKDNIFSKKRKTNFALENREFEKHYEWTWNDDCQIRMVFTPFLQELYLKICCNAEPPKYYQFCKYASFFGTNYIIENHNKMEELEKVVQKFATTPTYLLADFIKDLLALIQKAVHNFYKSISFMTIIPLIHSEDQTSLINSVVNKDQTHKLMTYHYVLTEILNENILKLDTQTVHSFPFESQTLNILSDVWLSKVNITGFAYTIHKQVIYIDEYSTHKGLVSVPVQYDDYIKNYQSAFLIFAKCSHEKYLYVERNVHSDADESMMNIIRTCVERIRVKCNFNKLVVLDGYLAFITPFDINLQIIKNDVEEIIKCLK